jgi:glycosyltransferase involved in cell wall biosynthesis
MSTAYELGYQNGRKSGMKQGKHDGRIKGVQETIMPIALLITPAIELPSFEIMLLQPFRELKRHGIYNFRIRTEDNVKMEDVMSSQIIIFLRTVELSAYRIMEAAHQAGKKTVYVIDDNFLEIPSYAAVASYYNDPIRRQTFQDFLRNAQLVKTDSTFFANYVRLYFNPKVTHFPSSVDFKLLEPVEKSMNPKPHIVIGYEGTQKDEDFELVVPALQRVLAKYRGYVKLQFHGYVPVPLLGHPEVSYIPDHLDYRSYIQNLKRSEWDVGLAPLKDTLFNYCKTNNKYREYAACLVPGIYSQSPPYTEWVTHGQTGYIVKHTQEDWFVGLCEMIENASLRELIKIQAGVASRNSFTVDVCANNWRQYVLHV